MVTCRLDVVVIIGGCRCPPLLLVYGTADRVARGARRPDFAVAVLQWSRAPHGVIGP